MRSTDKSAAIFVLLCWSLPTWKGLHWNIQVFAADQFLPLFVSCREKPCSVYRMDELKMMVAPQERADTQSQI